MIRLTFSAIGFAGLLLPHVYAYAAGPEPLRETATVKFQQALPNVPGKSLIAVMVDYPPGAKSLAHHHGKSAFIYATVLSGAVRSQVDNEPAKIYTAGESWTEVPGAYHRVSENASKTEPARLLAIFIADTGDTLTLPDAH